MITDAVQVALDHKLVQEGDMVVITAGTAGSTPGTTNLIKIQLIEQVLARGVGMGDHKVRGRVRKLTPPLPVDLHVDLNDIVVAHALDSTWQGVITNAGGMVVEEGSTQSYAARMAEDLHIPAIIGAAGAFDQLTDGEVVVLDPLRGLVYRGLSLDDVRGPEARVAALKSTSRGQSPATLP